MEGEEEEEKERKLKIKTWQSDKCCKFKVSEKGQ